MPPFNWDSIARHNYAYVIEKLKYAQNFYDLYRIDHVVGIFRVWSIPLSEPAQNGGLNGVFDPADENVWEKHGKDLLTLMVKHSNMLACAEDLGTVPNCCFKVLNEMGIPGIDVQRWMRDWGKSYAFKSPEGYRTCALATMATHDMSNLCAWWDFECGTVDEALFRRNCEKKNIAFDEIKERLFDIQASRYGRLRWKSEIDTEEKFLNILKITSSEGWALLYMYRGSFNEKQQFLRFLGLETKPGGLFDHIHQECADKNPGERLYLSIQLIQDYLDLDQLYEVDPWENRINFPGTLSEKNWTLVLQLSLDDILVLPINSVLKSINDTCGRK
jgi:4-alpha-glucanotransferase